MAYCLRSHVLSELKLWFESLLSPVSCLVNFLIYKIGLTSVFSKNCEVITYKAKVHSVVSSTH